MSLGFQFDYSPDRTPLYGALLMYKPFITVSIKTFNEAECIEKTIDSIRRQIGEYPHKIIVADQSLNG
ncbi:Uncharacterised protein [Leclercia adecarboxylata]|uniref:Glycosyltransferase n=1 Tax=Leclercia adecarboxylata TaxID=83655 RepID=A0A4U9HGE1_9ENTR|nr:Uncharacterised protein [Leclercia adecarboxylata]